MSAPFQPKTLYDAIGPFPGGVNLGISPLSLPKSVLAGAINTTVTGNYVTHRPCYQNRVPSSWPSGVQQLIFQGMTETVCNDDSGNAYIIALLSGRVFSFGISGNTVTCTELPIYSGGTANDDVLLSGGYGIAGSINGATITGVTLSSGTITTGTIVGGVVTNVSLNGGKISAGTVTGGTIIGPGGASWAITGSPSISAGFIQVGTISNFTVKTNNGGSGTVSGPTPVQPQAWLWQSECWVIIQDGAANPIVVNLNTQTAVRSNYGAKVDYNTTTTSSSSVAPVGSTFSVNFSSVTNLSAGDYLFIAGTGYFTVTNISGNSVTLQTNSGNGTLNSGELVQWSQVSQTLPPGRMGAYGQGRNWISLIAQRQFIALDLVQGASGTAAFQYRDAVLNSTENNYIVGGGTFSVPNGESSITAMKVVPQPGAAEGDGPIMVMTAKSTYLCQAPVDRLTWQNLTNPILPQSLIGYGGLSQWSTIAFNTDMLFRGVNGMYSWLEAQVNEGAWGMPPISFELNPIFGADNQALLNFGSAIQFGNRALITVGPVSSSQGTYWSGLAPINAYPSSSLRGKAPAVWDSGTWVGGGAGSTNQMQVFQMAVGLVGGIERAFALVLNTTASPNQIEFWEILADDAATADNDGSISLPINWQFDSASLRFGVPADQHVEMQLSNGEIWVDDLVGTVTIAAFYKPDQYPIFKPWSAWQTKQNVNASNSQPAFLPRQGLGEPSGIPFDNSTNRPFRQAFTFQFRLIVSGHFVFQGAFFEAQTTAMRKFAPLITAPLT